MPSSGMGRVVGIREPYNSQTSKMTIWGEREVVAFAFAAAAAVKKAGGHPEGGNAYQCHPQLLPASSFKDSTALLYPGQPLSSTSSSGKQL